MNIYKYQTLAERGHRTINMPQGAEILSCQNQNGTISIWASADPAAPAVARNFYVFYTGDPVPMLVKFVATIQFDNGDFVLHVFEDA